MDFEQFFIVLCRAEETSMGKSTCGNDEDLCSNLWQPCKNSGVDMHTCYPRGGARGNGKIIWSADDWHSSRFSERPSPQAMRWRS